MDETQNRLRLASIIGVAAGLALLAGTVGLGAGLQDDSSETTATTQPADPPPPQDSADPESRHRGEDMGGDVRDGGGRRFGRGGMRRARGSAERFKPGSYDVKIEIKQGTDSGSVEVLANGQKVSAYDAAFLMRFLRKLEGKSESEESDLAGPTLNVEQIDDVMMVVQDFEPLVYADLLELQRTDDQRRFAAKIRRLAYEYAREIEMRNRDEAAYQLMVEDGQLKSDERELQFDVGMNQPTDPSVIAEYRGEMLTILGARFEIQHALRGRDIERMKDRLDWVEKEWQNRLERKREILTAQVDDIFEELLNGEGR